MINLIDDWEWALRFTGDPASFHERSTMFLRFLRDEGLTTNSQVLDIGAGCLAPGKALIKYLAPGHYTGIEPFGMLVNVALRQFPELEHKAPRFLWNSDFDASETGITYDFAVAHSVLSHCAHHQMQACMTKIRAVMPLGGIWLASVILDQYNSFDASWVYPGTSRFRSQTLIAEGRYVGWNVERMPDYEQRLQEVAPNDTHAILRMTAIESSADRNNRRRAQEEAENDFRLAEEAAQESERHNRELSEAERISVLEEADDERVGELGWVQ